MVRINIGWMAEGAASFSGEDGVTPERKNIRVFIAPAAAYSYCAPLIGSNLGHQKPIIYQ